MLRSVEIRAALTDIASRGELFHAVHWLPRAELSLDCFICERTRRTTFLELAAERAVCTSDEEHGRHFTPARIAAFDTTTEDSQLMLRVIVDYWWAPFHDAKRDIPAAAITDTPWVRLPFGYYCRQRSQAGENSTQTNVVRPATTQCDHCGIPIATSREAPALRSLI